MGIIVAHEFMTLDGVIQSPGSPDEDTEGGFQHGGWQAPYSDPDSGQVVVDHYRGMEALLLGRKTYDIWEAYWPTASSEIPFTGMFNAAPKYVVSRTLERADWPGTTIVRGATAAEIEPIKQRHAEIHIAGGSGLMHSLLANDLVDRLNVWVYPLVLGSGKRLFVDGAAPSALRLVDSRTFGSGAVLLSYERAGKPQYGDMTEQ